MSGAVTPPHRTGSGPALDRASEGRPNHEEVDETEMGIPREFYKLLLDPGAVIRPSIDVKAVDTVEAVDGRV